jgi:4-carboxymuconolactone decarboxylase
MEAALVGTQRSLEKKTVELLLIVILTTLRGSQKSISNHVRRAIAAGSSPMEVLQALECIIAPSGLPIFEHGLIAWADAVGAEELHPRDAPFSS